MSNKIENSSQERVALSRAGIQSVNLPNQARLPDATIVSLSKNIPSDYHGLPKGLPVGSRLPDATIVSKPKRSSFLKRITSVSANIFALKAPQVLRKRAKKRNHKKELKFNMRAIHNALESDNLIALDKVYTQYRYKFLENFETLITDNFTVYLKYLRNKENINSLTDTEKMNLKRMKNFYHVLRIRKNDSDFLDKELLNLVSKLAYLNIVN